tara:strand:- start:379 stop:501 length:123 start_codon:yes stop_codon:yes gene_type:complete
MKETILINRQKYTRRDTLAEKYLGKIYFNKNHTRLNQTDL